MNYYNPFAPTTIRAIVSLREGLAKNTRSTFGGLLFCFFAGLNHRNCFYRRIAAVICCGAERPLRGIQRGEARQARKR